MASFRREPSDPEPVPPTEPTPSRLRTVTGNRFPRKCACGFQILRDPEVRYVVDFGTAKPYPAYLREHSPGYGNCHCKSRAVENTRMERRGPARTP